MFLRQMGQRHGDSAELWCHARKMQAPTQIRTKDSATSEGGRKLEAERLMDSGWGLTCFLVGQWF
jgi:hypothetical protein